MVEQIQKFSPDTPGGTEIALYPYYRIYRKNTASFRRLPWLRWDDTWICPPAKFSDLPAFTTSSVLNQGENIHIQLCHGTSCHVNQAADIIRELEKKLAYKPGQTTATGCSAWNTSPAWVPVTRLP
jgi:hypothetical protein